MTSARSGPLCAATLAAAALAAPVSAQNAPVGDPEVAVTYMRLSPDTEGFLLTTPEMAPDAHVAMVFSHPNRDNFGEKPGWFMAKRGYPVLLVNYRGEDGVDDPPPEDYLPGISAGIDYLKGRDGIDKVVLLTHSGGGHLGALYQNVAENGPGACSGPEKIVPCDVEDIEGLTPADGVVFLDTTLGAAHLMTAVDPAVQPDGSRDPALDMFTAANGYVPDEGATYAPEFVTAFYAAQAARNDAVIDAALERLGKIEAGEGAWKNDEPFVVRGMGVRAAGARPYQPDLTYQAHTKAPHLLLKEGGTEETVIHSVRPPMARHLRDLDVFGSMSYYGTVRNFLAGAAIRATPDYAVTADDVVGIDWASAYDSTPSNAEGIHVPTLVLTMSCHYLVVPGEIVYDHLAATDKTYASVEGAVHGFEPCKPEYGDTASRTFDFVDAWTAADGRF
jgi:hypothetical protein